jgi:hypothetical protein
MLVQRGSATIAAGTNTVTVDLTTGGRTPVPEGKSWLIRSIRANLNHTRLTFVRARLEDVVSEEYTKIVFTRNTSHSTEAVEIEWQIVYGDELTVQRGSVSFADRYG